MNRPPDQDVASSSRSGPRSAAPCSPRGHLLDFCYAVSYALLVVEVAAVVLLSVTAWPQLNQRR